MHAKPGDSQVRFVVRAFPIVSLLFFTLLPNSVRAQTFSTPMNISGTTGGLPLIAVDSQNNVDVSWAEATPAAGVFFSRSTDDGNTFAAPATVSASYAGGETLQMVVDHSSNIYLLWQSSNQHFVLSVSTNGGASFSTPFDLSTSLGIGTINNNLPTMALDPGNNINLIWAQLPQGTISFSRSTDGGATFSTPVTVGTFVVSAGAQIGIDSAGNLDVLWSEATDALGGTCLLQFSRSTDSGATFSPPQTLNAPDAECIPQLFVDAAGNINVMAFDGSGTYYRSANGGQTFTTTSNAFQPATANFGQLYASASGGVDTLVEGFELPNGPENDIFFQPFER